MAVRKNAKKSKKKADKKKAVSSPGIKLPAFGLAEEILGTRNEENAEDKSGIRKPKSEMEESAIEQGPELHLVTFNLDREEYGVDIGSVREIIRVGRITAVPNAPEFVKGVINVRGRVIPVLSLRKRLELPAGALTKNSRIMIVESGAKVLGLLVDSVSQVLRLPLSSVDAPPGEVEQTRMYVRGIGKIDSRLVMIMDLDRALAKDAGTGESAR